MWTIISVSYRSMEQALVKPIITTAPSSINNPFLEIFYVTNWNYVKNLAVNSGVGTIQ